MDHIASLVSKFVNSTRCHIFLTGKAGTGKTTLLKNIAQHTHKKVVVAAPTGIAAINAGGVTLHSLFHLPFGAFIPPESNFRETTITTQVTTHQSLIKNLHMNNHKRSLLREMELLIIDEVSMLRADLLDAIDTVLRYVRRVHVPFGGVQMLFIGDLLQLPPVIKREEKPFLDPVYPNLYFFNAKSLQQDKPVYLELEKIYRQTDKAFISILNRFRNNAPTGDDIKELNARYQPGFVPGKNDGYIHLTTHNRKADNINKEALAKLPGQSYFYEALVEGDFPEYIYPLDYRLELKKGAQVMFVKNDYSGEGRYFNGKIGYISNLTPEFITVTCNDGPDAIILEHYTWENKKFSLHKETNEIEEKITGTFSQFPIKLAWAITVHKSQGLTFDKAIVDVSAAFASGQVYVALSRLTSLKGLVLSEPLQPRELAPEETLREYLDSKESTETLNRLLKDETHRYLCQFVLASFNFSILHKSISDHAAGYDKDEKRSVKQKHQSWARELQSELKPVTGVADKFRAQLEKIINNTSPGYLDVLQQRVKAATEYFGPALQKFSDHILQQIQKVKTQKQTKTYLNELHDIERMFFKQLQLIRKSGALINSVMENTELFREILQKEAYFKDQGLRYQQPSTEERAGDNRTKKTRVQKPHTREISYHLFKEGKTVAEIAAERGLREETIEKHLAHYIMKGMIDIHQLVDTGKIALVREATHTLEDFHLKPVKEIVGDEISYGELRLIMAGLKYHKENR